MKAHNIIYTLIATVFSLAVHGQPLDSLLKKAYNNNPELKALQLEYEAALKKSPQVSQLPDPTIGVGVPILPVETRLGSRALTVSASQMFPWFGTLKAREDVVLTMARSKYERITSARLEIDYKVKTAYFNLYLTQAKQNIIQRNIRIFKTLEKVSLTKLESGESIASDVLTVGVEIEELNKQIQLIEEEKQIYISAINEALNNPPYTSITVDTSEVQLADLDYDLDSYKEKIQSNHPLIKHLDWNIETSKKELVLNKLDGMPTIELGLEYGVINKRSDATPINNGGDVLIPKVMVSIPLYRKKYAAVEQEEKLKQEAFTLQKDDLTNRMLSKIQVYKSEYESAKLMYELAHKQLELSNSSYDILLADYSSKGKRFDELMKLQSDINKYEIERIKAIINTHTTKFKIQRLTDF